MPPRVAYSKEMMVEAACSIVRCRGLEELNARSLAREIGGSTQPIYRVFASIEEVVAEVIKSQTPYVLSFMLEAKDDESEFLSIGLGYLRFAREEPHLFKLFFTSGRTRWDFTRHSEFMQPLLRKMRRDWYLRDLSDQVLRQLFLDMFLYTHGLCTVSQLDTGEKDPQRERQMLHDVGGQLIFMTLIREKQPELLNKWERSFKNEDISFKW
ncbi:MAG: TetR/AcrR family transcriptional regulator [bacterium]